MPAVALSALATCAAVEAAGMETSTTAPLGSVILATVAEEKLLAVRAAAASVVAAAVAPSLVPFSVAVLAPLAALIWELTWLAPRVSPEAPAIEKLMVSRALAPTWKACVVKVPSSSLRPLNEVVLEMRSSSDLSWLTSD